MHTCGTTILRAKVHIPQVKGWLESLFQFFDLYVLLIAKFRIYNL